jgi:hypothetical protein
MSEDGRETLPELLDVKGVQSELGVTRAAAEAIVKQCDVIAFAGLRKTYVKRADVLELVRRSTYSKGQVRP